MHFLMTALGSYGDVHPIAGLGGALIRRGHQVTIITNPHFRPVIQSVGAKFVPLGTEEDYDLFRETPEVWHPIRGPLLVMRQGIVKFLREIYTLLESHHRPTETTLVAHPLDFASRVFQEKHQASLASVLLAPLMFRSHYDPPKLGKLVTASWVPRPLRDLQYWLADKIVDSIICPTLDELRGELGLTPVRRVFQNWYYSPQLVLGLFPDWFGQPQPDWPQQVRLTGFPLWDQPAENGLPAEIDAFLDEGQPPIVFTPGSAMAFGQHFFQAAVEACQLLGRRGILLTKYPEQLPAKLPDSIKHFSFVPFSQLLPHAAAFVHHGGIGSCSQGLAAGVPQLLMPMAYDQPDNAARLKRLGVAESLLPKKFRGPKLAQKLRDLIHNETFRERSQHWAQQCDANEALALACEVLKSL